MWSCFHKLCIISFVVAIIVSYRCINASKVYSVTMTNINIENWVPDTVFKENLLANSIFFSEGGDRAVKPYGILSVPCDTKKECRRICLNTIRNNLKRYNEYGHKDYDNYIDFLASRYAPIGVGNDPTNLNRHWIKNVTWFLLNPKPVPSEYGD